MFITLVPEDDLSAPLKNAWEVASPGGQKFVRAIAHSPEHAARLLPYYNGLRFGTRLGPRLCELLRMAIAQTTQCPICLEGRLPAAFEEGLTEEEMARVKDPDFTGFDARDRSVINFALKFGGDHFSLDQKDFQELYEHFDEEEVTEIGMLCAQFLGFGRFVMTFGLEEPSCPVPGLIHADA